MKASPKIVAFRVDYLASLANMAILVQALNEKLKLKWYWIQINLYPQQPKKRITTTFFFACFSLLVDYRFFFFKKKEKSISFTLYLTLCIFYALKYIFIIFLRGTICCLAFHYRYQAHFFQKKKCHSNYIQKLVPQTLEKNTWKIRMKMLERNSQILHYQYLHIFSGPLRI